MILWEVGIRRTDYDLATKMTARNTRSCWTASNSLLLRPTPCDLTTSFFGMLLFFILPTKKSTQPTNKRETPAHTNTQPRKPTYHRFHCNRKGKHAKEIQRNIAHFVSTPPIRKKNPKHYLKRITKQFDFKGFRQEEGPYFVASSSKMLSVFQPD